MIKSFTTVLFVIIFLCIYTFAGFAQSADYDEKIWSIVTIDREKADNIKRDDYWVPAEQVPRFFDFATGITVEPNIRVKPGNTTQSELSIDVHPTNSNIVFGSANATNWNPLTTLYGTGVYWSLNGSTSWTGYDNPPFGTNSGDPVSVIGPDGRFYENYITNAYGLGVAVSTNNGANWTTHSVAPNPGQLTDKNHYMIDKTVGSSFQNRSYCIWTDFGGSNDGDAVLRYSTNFGQTWSASINLSNALSAFNQGVNVQTGPNGEVYATWAVYTGSFGSEDGIAFTKSVNGGVSWSTPVYAYFSTNFGIRGTLSSKNGIRVSSFPSMAVDRSGGPNNGNIYITWPQRGVSPAGSDPDIVLIKSTNGGATWSSLVRVNNDPINNGKDQYYSWCTVNQSTGQLMLVFYDSRNVPNNQAEVYMARSLDGGNTFENFQVSDQPHTPQPISGLAGGYAGDYIGVAALDNVAYPFWSDNRLGSDHYQAWTALVTFSPPIPDDPTNETATPVSDSQIDVVFTPNASSNNVVISWSLTGTFTTPTGTPPVIGQPFAGGNLLYNGTTSPVIHSDLNALTTYYYKAFSYDNVNYSPGIEVNATTLAIQAAIDILFLANDGSVPAPLELAVGLDLTATDGIDVALGEAALPPLAPGLDVRFQVVGAQSYRDYRAPGSPPAFPFTGTIQHNIMLKAADPAFDISLEYDLPPGAAFRITDKVGGSIFNIGPFTGTGVAVIPASYLTVFTSAWFYMDYGVTTFSLSVAVNGGWNMVSAPGTNPTGMLVGDWWPNLTGTVFLYDGVQYQPAATAVIGEGYWMENTVAETYSYPAIGIVPHAPIPVLAGWNMIGGYETTPTIAVLKAMNPQIIGSVFYYDGIQYQPAVNLVPGYGYWVETTDATPITILSALPKGSGEVVEVELFKEDWGRITLTDAEGKSYTLYAVKGEVDLDQYNMPPLPPAGSFDIRFSSGRIAEDINSSMQSIDLTGVTYPLTVRVDGMDIRLQDALGSVVNVNLKSGEDVVIGEATVQKLMVTGEVIPTVYALEQNYPNPFNPSTVIEFSLPEDVSNVKLSIYNTLGEKVAELVNAGLTAGKYQYQWNAKNVATGMYIYELQTDKFVSVKKMLLLK